MILFYSDFCQHCTILLDTIKRHDKTNMIKLVSIDTLRSLKKPIDPKIHSVPALLLVNTKEYMFGKAVFDYLLLPSRGILFSNQTRTTDKDNVQSETKQVNPDEPMAFTLGSISAENFSSIDDKNDLLNDKVYNWDLITSDTSLTPPVDNNVQSNGEENKKLPSMEEILKKRNNDISF